MKRIVLDFIQRRFPTDCNWLTGNCYYFAQILKERFSGEIWYDPIEGHFVTKIENEFYDWSGIRKFDYELYKWNDYWKIDYLHMERILRDCIR